MSKQTSTPASLAGTPEQTDAVRELRKACRCLYIAVDKVIADDVSRHAEAVIALIPATPASSDVLTEQADGMVRRLEGALRELEQLVKRDAKSDAQQVMDHTITSFVELRDHLRAPVPPSSSIAASETATTARPCTCHPADNPPRPCAEKYALSDCRPSADPSVTTDAETVNLPGWCLYCGGTYRTFAPGLAGCDNRECVRHPYINEANAAKKAAAWRGAPESSPAVLLCSKCGKHDARFACTDFLGAPAVDAGTTLPPEVPLDELVDYARRFVNGGTALYDRKAMQALAASWLALVPRSPAVDDETVKLLERMSRFPGHAATAYLTVEDVSRLATLAHSLRRAPEATPRPTQAELDAARLEAR